MGTGTVRVRVCLHVPSPSPSLSLSLSKFNIVPTVMVHLMDRMGTEPNLSIKRSISIDTMINFDSDRDGHGDGDGTCKQALKVCSHLTFLTRLTGHFLLPIKRTSKRAKWVETHSVRYSAFHHLHNVIQKRPVLINMLHVNRPYVRL